PLRFVALSLPASLRASIGLHAAAAALAVAVPAAWPWALGGVALNQAVLTGAGMWPRSTLLGPNLRRLPPSGRAEIVLSFDDGPDPEVTPRVLDLLDRHGARASFFCIGARARAHPRLVGEIIRRGHSVENHTDRHPHHFAALPPGRLRREIAAAQATLAGLAGTPPHFFRAPMGLRSPLLQPVLAGQGLRLVSWTRRALDGLRGDPAAAGARLRRGLAAGDVLLLHDGGAARAPDGRAVVLAVLPDLLMALAGRGLRSVTLGDGLA
ncbi:MAG TPA: polysaccharide deacetylase family protein, partial [Acetobacteraceae bacterium]|nr:polysaccharide deacetylase family protein [Acetobacteraceae bacterium]